MHYKHSHITDTAIGAFYNVYNKLGYGFLEQVYLNAMVIELNKQGVMVSKQKPINVYYENEPVGYYIADLVLENVVIVELKAAECICEEHEAQLINYLRATDLEVGLLMNFGKKAQFKRKIFDNTFKEKLKTS